MDYPIWANVYLALFYGFYWICLRKETFFQVNRWYLLGSILVAFLLPLLDLKEYFWSTTNELFVVSTHLEAQTIQVLGYTNNTNDAFFQSILSLPFWKLGYGLVCFFFLIKLIYQLFLIRKDLTGSAEERAYSFFKFIRIDPSLRYYSNINEHEQVHVNQLHSVDVLLIELVKVFNWFNPVIYLLKESAKLNHEYIADQHAAKSKEDRVHYAELLLNHAFDSPNNSLHNQFYNQSFIKKRITMLFKHKSKKSILSRFLILIPVLLLLASFQARKPAVETMSAFQDTPLVGKNPLVKVTNPADTNVVFTKVEVQAQPIGGMNEFLKYVAANFVYSQEAIAAKAKGRIVVGFIVEKDGSLSNVKIIRDLGYGTGEEAVRVIENGPKWNPANHEGKVVRAQYTLPIALDLGSSDEDSTKEPSATANENKQSQKEKIVETSPDHLFSEVESPPVPQGGMSEFLKYVGINFVYPKEAEAAKVKGRLIVGFIVEMDGSLSDVKIIRDLGYGTGEEAVRVISEASEKWSPGIQNGRPVRVQYTLPIVLNVDKPKKD